MTAKPKETPREPLGATIPGDALYTAVRVLRVSHARLMQLQATLTLRTGLRQTMSQALDYALTCAEGKENVHTDAP